MSKKGEILKKADYEKFLDRYILNPNCIVINYSKASKELNTDSDTLKKWANMPETAEREKGQILNNRRERRKALHIATLEGNPAAIKLEEQIVEGWSERNEVKHSGEIDINADDLAEAIKNAKNTKKNIK